MIIAYVAVVVSKVTDPWNLAGLKILQPKHHPVRVRELL